MANNSNLSFADCFPGSFASPPLTVPGSPKMQYLKAGENACVHFAEFIKTAQNGFVVQNMRHMKAVMEENLQKRDFHDLHLTSVFVLSRNLMVIQNSSCLSAIC